MRKSGLHVFGSPATLAEGAADLVEEVAREAIRLRDRFLLVLSGGSTPRALYGILDRSPRWGRIDWSRTEVFFGDERCVPPLHDASNYSMARDALLGRVPLRPGTIHRIQGELDPDEAAEAYETEVREVFGAEPVSFDLVLLGLGGDGHTASLFPTSPALKEEERIVLAATSPFPPVDRVTLTLHTINAARNVLFLVSGEEKSHALEWVVRGRMEKGVRLPASLVNPRKGRLLWFVDGDAAPFLRHRRGRP